MPGVPAGAGHRQAADHGRCAGAGGAGRGRGGAGAGGVAPVRGRAAGARHDARDQRADRAQGGADGAAHHAGRARRARDRLREALRALRHLSRQARAAGAAALALCGAGTDERRRRRAAAARRGARCEALARRLLERGHPVGRDRFFARLRLARPRAARARDSARRGAGAAGHDLVRGVRRDARVRALLDRLRQRLRASADGALSASACRTSCSGWACAARCS